MKKEWNPIMLEIVHYDDEDVIRTSNFDDGNTSTSKDDFEGEIDWG